MTKQSHFVESDWRIVMIDRKARQGDLLIIKVDSIPNPAKPARNKVVALGEITGHSHRVYGKGAAVLDVGPSKYVDATEPWSLLHEEHENIKFSPGKWEIRRQREYTPEEIRQVAD